MPDPRIKTVSNFERALDGEVVIHVWGGPQSDLMKTIVAAPGEVVDFSVPDDKANTGVRYRGVMSDEEIATRLAITIESAKSNRY